MRFKISRGKLCPSSTLGEATISKERDMKVELNIECCLDCPNHESGYDPDPYDSFNSDDMYCACKLLPNERLDKKSRYVSEQQPYKIVSSGDRPYQLKKYSVPPRWCPIRVKE